MNDQHQQTLLVLCYVVSVVALGALARALCAGHLRWRGFGAKDLATVMLAGWLWFLYLT